MPRTAPRAVRRKARPVNQIHRKVGLRKKYRKMDEPAKFIVNWK